MKRSLIVLALAASTSANAQRYGNFVDGNMLYRYSGGDSYERGVFYGYVSGVFDQSRIGGSFCQPDAPLNMRQIGDIVRNYLALNPAQRHRDADILVNHALREAWPCRNKPKPAPSLEELIDRPPKVDG